MSKETSEEAKDAAKISIESIKAAAEALGISGLADDAAKYLAEDVTHHIRLLVQDASKFMAHSKRKKLHCTDIDSSLRIRNLPPVYGFIAKDDTPFRLASGGGREIYFMEEKEMDIAEIVNSPLPRLPLDVTLKSHWLAVEGVQPSIPENPPPLSKDMQKMESIDPADKLGKANQSPTKRVEVVRVKQLATHELSVEQQLYYKEITEACVGSDESRRTEALQSLSCDPGLHQMLPRLCTFIAEGVRVNVVQNNLALLIYLMRMVKALLDNSTLYLEKYLHEIVPTVATCIVTKQLCILPERDNHWALRDFGSRLMAQISKNFNTSTNNIQTRITRLFSKPLMSDKTALATQYGAIAGLIEMGHEVIKSFLLPRVKTISDSIQPWMEGTKQNSLADKTAADKIKQSLIKSLPPALKNIRSPPDILEEYVNDFGVYLGPILHTAVIKLRIQPASLSISQPKPTVPVNLQPRIIQMAGARPTTPFVNIQRPSVPTTPTTPTQKYVLYTQPGSATSAALTGSLVKTMVPVPPSPSPTGTKIVMLAGAPNAANIPALPVRQIFPATVKTEGPPTPQS